jgi:type IV pilus assembly protein PilE
VVELLVAIAVVAVIAAVAMPSYQAHILRARRADAQTALMDLAQAQERHHAENATFETDLTVFGYSSPERDRTAGGHYEIRVEEPTGDCPIVRCFVLVAAPVADSHQSADRVTALRLHSTGLKERLIGDQPLQGWK